MPRGRRPAALAAAALALALLAAVLLWRGRARDGAAGAVDTAPAAAPEAAPPAAVARPLGPELAVALAPPQARGPADAPALFEGTVVSAASGAGIPGAELTFSRSGEATGVTAGAGGRFRFAPRAEGRWTLAAVTAPGFLPFAPEWGHSPVQLDARAGGEVRGLVVTLAPAQEYVGRVVDARGQPVAGAEVRVLGAAAGETALIPLRERYASGPDGEFRFVAPDGAVLEARHATAGRGRARVDFGARIGRRVTIELEPASREPGAEATIAGRVEDPSGAPVEGALVVGEPMGWSAEAAARQARSDEDGRFALRDVDARPHRLVATRPGFAPGVLARVAPGTADAVLRLRAGASLEGAVRERGTGAPVASFTVAVRGRGRERLAGVRTLAVVDAGGRFALDDLAPGPSVVVVSAAGHAPSREVEVEVPAPGAAPARVEVELGRGGRVHGTIVDARTKAPIAGASVEVEGQVDLGPSALPVRSLGASGEDGRFELTGVPPGPVSLFASAAGHHARIISGVSVAEGEARGPVSIALTPTREGEDPTVELTGIGAVLARRGDALVIVDVSAGGGAAEAGLARGDAILRIDGRAVAELTFPEAVSLIRGPEDSSVVLGVRKRDDPQRAELRVVVIRRLVRGS